MTYPRSFLGLLLAGFTLVALPLVGALAYSAWNTERLAGQSRSAVFNASQAARASRSLVERIGSIERLAQQVAVMDDPELFQKLVTISERGCIMVNTLRPMLKLNVVVAQPQ